jgi:DNA polymerase I-like protein with 3'-5' exonuclease and polymerase domains
MAKDRYDRSTDDFLLRLDLSNPEIDWSPPTELPDLTRYNTISVDLETHDPNLSRKGPGWATGDGKVVGVAVAAGDFKGYFPIRHQNGPNLDPRMVLRWLKDHMTTDATKVMHNALYDMGWMRREGIEVRGPVIDTMIAGAVVDENRNSYSLDALARDYIAMRKDEKALRAGAKEWGLDPKSDMWRLPARYVGAYAETDAVATLRLWERLRTEIEGQDLWSIFTLESDLLPVLLDMRTRGVRIDESAAERAKEMLEARMSRLHADLQGELGFALDHWSAVSVAKAFDHYGLAYPRTDTGSPSFTKQFLKVCEHPIASTVVSLREADKAGGTFIDGIIEFCHNGRIHCEFHQLRSDDGGAVTGRFSSSNPNLQNQPARDKEIKALIRGLFLPEEGQQWGSFDYSSQEPTLLVHFAASMPPSLRHPLIDRVVEAFHRGERDLHQMVADIMSIPRKPAKAINLGIMYGMGVGKLANELGISVEEAKILLARYHDAVPFVKKVAETAQMRAAYHGQVRTVLGRLCRFHLWEPISFGYNKPLPYEEAQKVYGNIHGGLRRGFVYKALNKVIQGSAADQTKKAMVECARAGLLPMLTVHDELCFSIAEEAQVRQITEIMETCVPLKVPSVVDVALGRNWGEID